MALKSLSRPQFIDQEFYDRFNSEAYRINPKNIPDQEQFGKKRILDILTYCYQKSLVRRLEHLDFDHIPRERQAYAMPWRLERHKVCLTPKGGFLLQLAQDPVYQELTCLSSWRTQVADYIAGTKAHVLLPVPTYILDREGRRIPIA